jgi:hypothetical protein
VAKAVPASGVYNWLVTDDDSGNKLVMVSAVFATTGGNDQEVPGVPDVSSCPYPW